MRPMDIVNGVTRWRPASGARCLFWEAASGERQQRDSSREREEGKREEGK